MEPLIEEGYAALRAGDGATARRVFDRVLATEPSGAGWEGAARAAYVDRDYAYSH